MRCIADFIPYLEECISCVQLKDDASYTPHVTRMRPAQFWNAHVQVLAVA